MMPHLRDEDLISLHFGLADETSASTATTHLASCEACRKRQRALVGQIQGGLDTLQGPVLASDELIAKTLEAVKTDDLITSSRQPLLAVRERHASYGTVFKSERAQHPDELPSPVPELVLNQPLQRPPPSYVRPLAWAVGLAAALMVGYFVIVPDTTNDTFQVALAPEAKDKRDAVAPQTVTNRQLEDLTLAEAPAPAAPPAPAKKIEARRTEVESVEQESAAGLLAAKEAPAATMQPMELAMVDEVDKASDDKSGVDQPRFGEAIEFADAAPASAFGVDSPSAATVASEPAEESTMLLASNEGKDVGALAAAPAGAYVDGFARKQMSEERSGGGRKGEIAMAKPIAARDRSDADRSNAPQVVQVRYEVPADASTTWTQGTLVLTRSPSSLTVSNSGQVAIDFERTGDDALQPITRIEPGTVHIFNLEETTP